MSFGVKDLVALAGVPGLGAGVSLRMIRSSFASIAASAHHHSFPAVTATYSTLENIKVYRVCISFQVFWEHCD